MLPQPPKPPSNPQQKAAFLARQKKQSIEDYNPLQEFGEIARAAGEQVSGERQGVAAPVHPELHPIKTNEPDPAQDEAYVRNRMEQLRAEMDKFRNKEKQENLQEKKQENDAKLKKEEALKKARPAAEAKGRQRKGMMQTMMGIVKKKQTSTENKLQTVSQ